MKYVALLRGINVGGKNRIKMADLKKCFEDLGFENVITYIQSGNVIFETDKSASSAAKQIETALPKKFKLDSDSIKTLVLSQKQFKTIIDKAPKEFGKKPDKYYYDFVFLKGITSEKAAREFESNPEVDTLWIGPGVIYHRRLTAKRTKSRMAKIVGKPVYKNVTIRSWSTTSKILALIDGDN